MPRQPIASFDGTVDQLVVDTPTVQAGLTQKRGLPVYVTTRTNESFPYDPWLLKESGRIASTAKLKIAKRGHGKTLDNMNEIMMFIGRKGRKGAAFRIQVDDHRRDNGEPEYEDLVTMLGGIVIRLANYQLNILDMEMGMTFSQQLGMVKIVLKHCFGGKLTPGHAQALRFALRIGREQFPDALELELLPMILRSMSEDDGRDLLEQRRKNLAERFAGDEAFNSLREKPWRLSKRLLDDCDELASMIEELLDGEYGEIIGGIHSLSQVLTHNLVSFDYSGLTDEAVMLVQSMMWYWRSAALINKDFRFRFDMEIHDENYKLWEFPVYAKAMHQYLKQLRSHGTYVILSTQSENDYATIGEKGSQTRRLAKSSIREIDVLQIGQLDRTSAKELRKSRGLTREEQADLETLKVGCWGYKVGNEPIVWISTDPIDELLELGASDGANDDMLV